MSRFCFVKGDQVDALGRRKIVAVPVAYSNLRRSQPDTSILDLDPVNEWIGGQPGRLHGVRFGGAA